MALIVPDIERAIESCRWILDNYFATKSTPLGKQYYFQPTNDKITMRKRELTPLFIDERYTPLRDDIHGLKSRCEKLYGVLERSVSQPELAHGSHQSSGLELEVKEISGDFVATLLRCTELLPKQVALKSSQEFLLSERWTAETQTRADELRKHIQFHAQKIYLVIETLELGLTTTLNEDVAEILEVARQSLSAQKAMAVPSWLRSKFRNAIDQDPPTFFTDTPFISLKEGFDTLYYWFRASTYQFHDPETGDQTIEQYLNLHKSQWILEILQESKSFQELRPRSLYRQVITQVQRRIDKEYARSDLRYFDQESMENLHHTSFSIWPPKSTHTQRPFPDQIEEEDKILKMDLSDSKGAVSLECFRTGPSTLRMVRKVIPHGSTVHHREIEDLNIYFNRFIPYYAISDSNSAPRVVIYRGNGTGGMVFEPQNDHDMRNFQRAFTGYQVVHENEEVKWALNQRRLVGSKSLQGIARLQIWHWKPLNSDRSANESYVPQSSRAPASTIADSGYYSKDPSDAQSTRTKSTMTRAENHSPVLLLYTKYENKYTYFYVECEFNGYN
jgi:hypothetical protein